MNTAEALSQLGVNDQTLCAQQYQDLQGKGTCNVSGKRRRVLHLSYTLLDQPQQLVQQEYITPALYERMNEAHHYLLDI